MLQQKNSTKCVSKICQQCSKEYLGHPNSKLCSIECKQQHKRDYENNNRHKKSLLKYSDDTDPYIFVECVICGFRSPDISTHIQLHKISNDDYKKQYGNTKSQQLIDAVTGDKNPAYDHGGKLSPFSKNYIYYESDEKIEELKSKAAKTKSDSNNNHRAIGYYLSRGYSQEESEQKLIDTQTTFSLEICKEKHGEEEGHRIWKERQIKWLKSFSRQNYSKISQDLFNEIVKLYVGNIYYATYIREDMINYKNKEYRLVLENGRVVLPDFIDLNKNKIIEFDGDYWHSEKIANPTREKHRDASIIDSGYEIKHIKECDYKKNKLQVIQECLDFLTQ